MKEHDVFWKLGALSDRQLLERLGSMLGSSRRLMAELIAHLGEVEERRLHLVASCSSMFAYCLKLGMTEDEAYRRIEVARLARRYPAIFPLLAEGQLSISVVALLKHYLSDENHLDLLASAAGKTVAQTRELIAARFPRPDVASSVRKLPERRTVSQPSFALSMPTEPSASGAEPRTNETRPDDVDGAAPSCMSNVTEPRGAPGSGEAGPLFASNVTERRMGQTEPLFASSNVTSSTKVPASAASAEVARTGDSMSFGPAVNATCTAGPEKPPLLTHPQRVVPPRSSSRIEPLSAQRYKVQLTASAELAHKLELARDLMRHCQPDGELGPIVERALDLLIERLMLRRFGKKARPKRTNACAKNADPEPGSDVMNNRATMGDTAGPARAAPPSPPEPSLRSPTAPRTSTHATTEPARTELRSRTLDSAEPATTTSAATRPDTTTTAITTPATITTLATITTAATTTPDSAGVQVVHHAEPERALITSYIPRSTRRAVIERDGLGCSWMDEHGVRCGSRAWLEYDHCRPRGKGGGSEPDNLRLLCRHHNRFAAEREYGRKHVERRGAERRRARAPHTTSAIKRVDEGNIMPARPCSPGGDGACRRDNYEAVAPGNIMLRPVLARAETEGIS